MDESTESDHIVSTPSGVNPVRNTVVLSASFLLCYTAFQGIQNLQSSLNQAADLGVASLACVYATIILAGILTPLIVHYIGTKLSFVLSWVSHCLYTAANFYPTWGTLIPASLLLGLGVAPMWTSQGIYITSMADSYSETRDVGQHEAMSKLFGIFGLLFQSAQIAGNLIASLVLFRDTDDVQPANETRVCGADDCPGISNRTTVIIHPKESTVNLLMGMYFVCDFVGLFLTICCLQSLPRRATSGVTPASKVRDFFTSFWDLNLILLTPFYFAKSMIVAILLTSFTKAFVSCTVGVRMVGYVMAVYGGSTATFSYIFGLVAKYSGRYPLFAACYLIELGAVLFMLLWKPSPDLLYVNFLFVIACSISDGMWLTQSGSLVGLLFEHKRDTAFANFMTVGALGFAVTLAYDRFVCLSTKLYVSIALWILGSVCYIIVEIRVARQKKIVFGYEEIN